MEDRLIETAKERLDNYYNLMAVIDKMAVGDALERLKSVAEDLVDTITDFVYCE